MHLFVHQIETSINCQLEVQEANVACQLEAQWLLLKMQFQNKLNQIPAPPDLPVLPIDTSHTNISNPEAANPRKSIMMKIESYNDKDQTFYLYFEIKLKAKLNVDRSMFQKELEKI
jgi:hypothetical protein